MGIHADLLDPADIVMMAKWLVVAEILYAFNLGWTKISLLMMYYRIFRLPYFKKMAWAVGTFVMVWVVTITFLFIFICVPVAKMWYPDLPGKCINQVATWIANAAVWGLKLGKREKIGLTAAFGLGSLYVYPVLPGPDSRVSLADNHCSVVFASAYRTSVLFTYTAGDPSYTLAPTVGWTAIEMAAGIISANLPTMLPALNLFLRMLGIRTRNGTSPTGSSNPFRSKDKSMNSQGDMEGAVPPPTGKRASGTVFYRLPDENTSSHSTPGGGKLRPDSKTYQYTVQSLTPGERDEESGDEIPLHGIRVEKHTMAESSRVHPTGL
jgi:hypothetical protein